MRAAALLAGCCLAAFGMLLWADPPDGAPPPKPDGSIHFDPNRVERRLENGHWILRSGTTIIKDFGPDGPAANSALRLIQQQSITDLAWVGTPQPAFEFFLVNNRPPRALVGDFRSTTFQPDELKVKSKDLDWWLVEDKRQLLLLGRSKADADNALALIKLYRCNQITALTQGPSPLVFLAAGAHVELSSMKQFGKKKPNEPAADQQSTSTIAPGSDPTAPSGQPSPAGQDSHAPSTARPQPKPKPDPMAAFQRVAFNPGQILLQHPDTEWQLVVGRVVLKNFGIAQRDALLALNAMQHFGFTEQYRIEGEDGFEFYLSQGQAPRGRMVGQTAVAFGAKALTLRRGENEDWWLDANPNAPGLFHFHSKEHAEQALEAIRKYQFDHVYRIGQPTPLLTYFTRAF